VGARCGGCIHATTAVIEGEMQAYCALRKLWVLTADRACVGFRPDRDVAGDLLADLKRTAEDD
jgi:hypothetical protein